MGDGGGERDGDLWGDSNLGGGEGGLGGDGEGEMGEMGIWLVETVMWRVVERGMWGWGSLPILPSIESCGGEWRGNWYCRGTWRLWSGGSGGGDLCLFCQARRVVGESGGGIGITGEPAHCSVSVFFS